MKRSTKLILLLMVAVALGCGYLAVQNFSEKETVETADASYPLLDEAQVVGMSWSNGEETFTLEKQDDAWVLAGEPDFPMNQTVAADMAAAMEGLTATRQLTGVESLEDYGLDAPLFTVTLTLADGSALTVEQGDENALSSQHYVKVSGDDSVYLVSDAPANTFALDREDMMATEALGTVGDLSTIVLKTPTSEQTFRYEPDASDRYVNADTGKLMDTEAVESFAEAAAAIQWTGVVSYTVDDEALIAYGLDEPMTELYITSSGETEDENGDEVYTTYEYSLLLGGFTSQGDEVYAMVKDGSMIYTIAESDANPIFQAVQGSLESNQALAVDWDNLSSMSLMQGSETITVNRRTATAATSDADAQTAETADSDAEATAEAEETADAEAAAEVEETADAEADETADAEADESTDQWQVDGVDVDAEQVTRIIDLLSALETSDIDAPSDASDYLTLAFVEADGATVTMTLQDESADAYAVAGEAKTVPAAAIDEVARLMRHLK